MKQFLAVAALVLVAAFLTPSSWADSTVHMTWTDPNGQDYYISTGSTNGYCVSDDTFASCSGTSGVGGVNEDGCTSVAGHGSCIVVSTGWTTAQGTTSVKCSNGTVYQVSDGGSGQCGPVDRTQGGGTISCSQANTSNYASASCDSGCGAVSGTGSCTVR